jgi:phage gp36-like protein
MTYCTQAQLSDRYGDSMLIDLTDRAVPATGTIDTDVIGRSLADTYAMIDGYLLGRYVLPLSVTPPLIIDLAQVISIYKLHRNVPEQKIVDDYKQALAILKQIADGTVRLSVEGVEPAASGSSGVRTNEPCRPLTADSLKGFI